MELEWITNPESLLALLSLTALEIVLGIDNVVFISILAGRLPKEQQNKARLTGLALAMISRILLLFSIVWIMKLTLPLFTVLGQEISGRDLLLIAGGLFLLAKSNFEIHDKLEGGEGHRSRKAVRSFANVIVQILILDLVFSLDSVITAVGMAREFIIMVLAVILAVGVMMASSKSISDFVEKHPTVKMLALAFLLLIGVTLIAEGFEQHIPKGYIYFAMAFSVFVEMLNLRMRSQANPVLLRKRFADEG